MPLRRPKFVATSTRCAPTNLAIWKAASASTRPLFKTIQMTLRRCKRWKTFTISWAAPRTTSKCSPRLPKSPLMTSVPLCFAAWQWSLKSKKMAALQPSPRSRNSSTSMLGRKMPIAHSSVCIARRKIGKGWSPYSSATPLLKRLQRSEPASTSRLPTFRKPNSPIRIAPSKLWRAQSPIAQTMSMQ